MSEYKVVPVEPTAEMMSTGGIEMGARDEDARTVWKAMIAAAPAVQGEPVYLYRRRGFRSFETCNHVQYAELSAKPRLFETKVLYTAPQPAPDVKALMEALRVLVAAGHRLNDEAEECTYDDGMAEVASYDFWGYFREALEAADAALAAYRKGEES